MSEYEHTFGSDGRRFERERGLGDGSYHLFEQRRAANLLWLAAAGSGDSRGGLPTSLNSAAIPAASQRDDARLWRAVRETLFRCGFGAVEVGVYDGVVTLEGAVADIPTRVMAEECCLRLPEVRDVRNRLRVAPPMERELGA